MKPISITALNFRFARWARVVGSLLVAFIAAGVSSAASKPLQIRVVIVTTFEVGNDTGDMPGEFQNWFERYPLPQTLPFPQGYRSLRYNPRDHVLGIVTGAGKASAAASIMALGMDPRFDLRQAYWILAGIGGIDPAQASVGSAAWASYVVDGDLAYEIDAREIPDNWPTGIVAYDRAAPFEKPEPPAVSDNGILAYSLNDGLTSWAYGLTRSLALPDDDKLKSARAGYPDQPNAQRPPFVLKGDTLTADRFWIGARMTDWAEKMGALLDQGRGPLHDFRGGGRRLSSGAHFPGACRPRRSGTRARSQNRQRFLDAAERCVGCRFSQERSNRQLPAYGEAIENAYLVGSRVVRELADHWPLYRQTPRTAKP